MTEYVAGFMFNSYDEVLLIKKNRPNWQAGKLNAIGGHIEPGEQPLDAMVREFQEEAFAKTDPFGWKNFLILSGKDFKVYFYSYFSSMVVRSMTDESISWIDLTELKRHKTIANIPWLVEMALSFEHERCDYFNVTEGYYEAP